MAVYSVMVPDEKLLKAVTGLKRITIVGCGGCANDSLAYARNLPLKMRFDNHMGHNMPEPDIMLAEVKRLQEVFSSEVKDIRTVVGMGMCAISDNEKTDEFEWVKACRDTDAIVAVTCVAGIVGIKTALGNKVKIIPGMKTTGVLFSYFRTSDNSDGHVYIDKEKSSCINIFK